MWQTRSVYSTLKADTDDLYVLRPVCTARLYQPLVGNDDTNYASDREVHNSGRNTRYDMMSPERQSARMSKITKWRLNPVWHRMLYSCVHMTIVGVKG